MRAFASSLHAWKSLERVHGVKVPHGLVFPLAVVQEIGRPHGLVMEPEELTQTPITDFDAIMISVLDSRCMLETGLRFKAWKVPIRRQDRGERWPVVIAGGSGLHNPRPYEDIADVICVGDGEDTVPAMLAAFHSASSRAAFLAACTAIPGLWVPSLQPPHETTIVQAVASDISITLRTEISVSHTPNRRMEIARGCKYKCTFCSLGWRTPMRENPTDQIISAIRLSGKQVHLQAGDAESHSGINEIRSALREHGGRDQGWTGRLDSLFENPDQTIPGGKRYAFGVEGVSFRLRRAVGKGYLTDDRLVDDSVRFFGSLEGDAKGEGHVETKGRAAWHIIAGLPTETLGDALSMVKVIKRIDYARRGMTPRNLSLHWQPFQPLPGTPAQWLPAGRGARKMLAPFEGLKTQFCVVRNLAGRTDRTALICSALARSDNRAVNLLEAYADDPGLSVELAQQLCGATIGPMDPDAPLPWDFISTHMPKETLRRAYEVMMSRFAERV